MADEKSPVEASYLACLVSAGKTVGFWDAISSVLSERLWKCCVASEVRVSAGGWKVGCRGRVTLCVVRS